MLANSLHLFSTYSRETLLTKRAHQANFIVPNHPTIPEGVIEAVYRDLKNTGCRCEVSLRRTPEGAYIRILAPTEQDAMALMETAEDQANMLILDEPDTTRGLFVEPAQVQENYTIALSKKTITGYARPCLEPREGTQNRCAVREQTQMYSCRLAQTLARALAKTGRLYAAPSLRIHLGHFELRRYRTNISSYSRQDFEDMIRNPRATGQLITCLGNKEVAKAVIGLMRQQGSPFVPRSSQSSSTGGITPDYIFEAYSADAKFEAKLEPSSERGDVHDYRVHRPKIFPQTSKVIALDITSVSIEKNLDWKVEALREDKNNQWSEAANDYFGSAKIRLQGQPTDLDTYPKVHLAQSHTLANHFKRVSVISTYRFGWKTTGYVLELAFNRHWDGIKAMVQRHEPTIDLSLSIRGESWAEDMETSNGQLAGMIWGKELGGLLPDESGSAVEKVTKFLEAVRQIRDAFEDVEGLNGLVS
ncbi:hypothetical protein F5Y15DRAFT_205644 [Xylariaceae sp. FL0016]|nr:hypothetical protein F5Y15DRAFT_205644 [Xylariaceae sp. FL0016]